MAGLGSAQGGPVAMKPDSLGNPDGVGLGSKQLLNTHIHNYFMDEGYVEIAKLIRQTKPLGLHQDKIIDRSRKGANGADDSMDTDNKDDLNNRIDGPNGQGNAGDSFLSTWWGIFWDMWTAARQRDKSDPSAAAQYLAHTQVQRQRQHNAQLLQQSGGMMQPNFQYRSMMPTGMNDLQKRAMVNNGRMNPVQIQNMQRIQQQQMAAQNQMQRDGSDMDMNAPQRGQSPMPGENAPSPKRARIDSGSFNPGQMGGPNGRVPGMGQQPQNGNAPNAMLINSSFDPMSPASFNQLNGPPKSAQHAYSAELLNNQRKAMGAALPNNGMNPGNMPHGSPMMNTGPDGPMMSADLFPPNAANTMRGGMAGGNGGALADYQMQLMLLEQQNKKRLLMARQEQDVQHRVEGGGPQGMMAPQGYAQPMSPQGSRTRHSPNSNDPTKRGTPKDSPLPDAAMGGPRVSPAPPNFEQGPMPPNMGQPFGIMGGPNGMMVRPTNGHPGNGQISQAQMEMMRRQPMMGNNGWAPGMPNPGQMLPQGQPPQVDSAQQRNNMPPPPTGRTQPPSPQQSAAPPTPSQANKANPKTKKDNKDTKKKPAKKASTTTGATPSAETEQSDDVPPPTPSTPKNAASNLIKGPAPSMNINMQTQPPASIPPPSVGMSAPPDNNSMAGPFSSLENTDISGFGDFDDLLGVQDTTDVLHGFDFDAFLHQDPIPGGFDFDPSQYLNGDPLETGMGD